MLGCRLDVPSRELRAGPSSILGLLCVPLARSACLDVVHIDFLLAASGHSVLPALPLRRYCNLRLDRWAFLLDRVGDLRGRNDQIARALESLF